MSIKETIGNATLYLGDSRELLPIVGAVNVLITDPVWPNCPAGLLAGADDPHGLWRSFWLRYSDVKQYPTRAVAVLRHDSDPRFLQPIPLAYARAVILPYVMPGYIGRYLGGDEIAYCFGSPIPSRAGQRVIPGRAPAVQPDGRRANGHPCSRALEHFQFLVRWWSEPAEIVLDPFMGSGTTGVACIDHGRPFVGIEIDPTYFDIACTRIEAELRRPRLPLEEPPRQIEAQFSTETR